MTIPETPGPDLNRFASSLPILPPPRCVLREPSITGSPTPSPCIPWVDGRWLKKTGLAAGTYEYCLVVDGRWMPDPLAAESVPNPFGGRNSLLKVTHSPGACSLGDAELLPPEGTNL